MKKVLKFLSNTDQVGDCLVWKGAVKRGYPRVGINGNSNARLHRYIFEVVNGELPEVVRHTCDNPLCINPQHLIAGTQYDNVQDRNDRDRTHSNVSEGEKNLVFFLRGLGMSYKEIAKTQNINPKRVGYILQRLK
ncbi:endonuclease [Pseudomonas phage UFV-P2]|uniref:HNH endonuclease n=1 Tax=Pseudomonas phage UFV-P2 TaxID=1235661 RepID=K0ILN9_9CAUD|nr:endonuclease [Pseudomonas phage UFV-P2]AFU62949.2 HNH endonuclease [Pseudomonas phage UFV-P2]